MTEKEIKEQESSDDQESQQQSGIFDHEEIQVDTRRASKVGALSAVIVFIGALMVGEASGSEARVLLDTSLETTRSFCGTVTLALGNILALMLTLLSISASTDIDLKWSHYQRVRQVALFTTITLISSILIYLLLNVPLEQSETASDPEGVGFPIFYYTTLILASILGGALIAVVIMLYNTIRDIIDIFGKRDAHKLVRSDEDE